MYESKTGQQVIEITQLDVTKEDPKLVAAWMKSFKDELSSATFTSNDGSTNKIN